MSFWNTIPACSKIDILEESRHTALMLRVMADSETDIERVGNEDYTLYGPEEALLARPRSSLLKLGFTIYCMIVSFLRAT